MLNTIHYIQISEETQGIRRNGQRKGLRFHGSDHTAAGGHCASQRRWDAAVTRAQLAVILNGLLGRTLSSLDDLQLEMPIFDDNRDAQV